MTLKGSSTTGSFAVPLSEVVTLRDEIDSRIAALRSAMSSMTDTDRTEGAMTALSTVRGDLSGMISATRAAGKRTESPADDVLNRAAARLLQRMADDLDRNAEKLMVSAVPLHALDPLTRQKRVHEAQTSEAEAARLWYVLTVFMEHTGMGPEDLDDDRAGRQPRQASALKHHTD
ncbi:hypothetical protein [Corynebacterium kalidii]